MAAPVANTKHFKVSKLLTEQVRFMSPGDLLPTVEELKKKFDCSQATITQAVERLRLQGLVIRPSGKKRLVVADLNARPKFRLTLIRPLWSSPDYDSITNRIYELGHEEHFGFSAYVYNDSDLAQLNLEHALKQADAGLIIGNLNVGPQQIEAFNSSRKPIVFLRDKPPTVRAGSLWVDDIAVGQMATKHLLDLGHRNIALMLSEPYNPSSTNRLKGWRLALQKKGIKDIDPYIADCSVLPGKEAITGSYEKFCAWLDGKPPAFTALFCVGWTGAFAAMRALRERGKRIPEDVSVITYASEAPLCNFTAPPITAVEMDLGRYTRLAIGMVREKLAGGQWLEEADDIKMAPHLVIRESTAKLQRPG
jgi:LacI family transcriptional regulator